MPNLKNGLEVIDYFNIKPYNSPFVNLRNLRENISCRFRRYSQIKY